MNWLSINYGDTYTYKVQKLKKRYRISHLPINRPRGLSSFESAYCFIDFEGNIFKAASWSTPAKGIRCHIDKLDVNDLQLHSVRYLK